jgi:hypothetical protein
VGGQWWRALALATGLAVVGALGPGCSSGDGEDRSGGEEQTSTTAPAPGPAGDTTVVGTWRADGAEALVAALSDQGLDEIPTCDGAVILELGPDGTLTRTTTGTCDFGDEEGEVELVTTGGFATEEGQLVLTDVTGSGTIRNQDGDDLELPDEQLAEGGAIGYRVSGDELVLSVGEESSVTFTRA